MRNQFDGSQVIGVGHGRKVRRLLWLILIISSGHRNHLCCVNHPPLMLSSVHLDKITVKGKEAVSDVNGLGPFRVILAAAVGLATMPGITRTGPPHRRECVPQLKNSDYVV